MDSTSLGLIVRRERKGQKLKQAELAAVSGVGIRFIVELEAGKPTLQLEKVLRVITTLGCDIIVTQPGHRHWTAEQKLAVLRDAFGPEGCVRTATERHETGNDSFRFKNSSAQNAKTRKEKTSS